VCEILIKNSQPFGKKILENRRGGFFLTHTVYDWYIQPKFEQRWGFFTTVVNATSGNQIYISGFSVNISFNNDDNSIARNARRRRKCDENKSISKT